MQSVLTRRSLLKNSSLVLGASFLPTSTIATAQPQIPREIIHLNLNENAFGPSPNVEVALRKELPHLSRYASATAAQEFAEQIAAYERVPVEQVVLGEILGELGLYFGSEKGSGGEFLYSTPGYLALINAASRVGGVGVGVPLNEKYENDLPALAAKVNDKTRALYLINPHNPTGTISEDNAFKKFLRDVSQRAPVIVDEAYLEYTPDFETRSAVSVTRDGANVLVFRTFDKIHGLAGLPIGYTLVPRDVAVTLRKQGIGDAESLGRLNIAAASAALADTSHVRQIRSITIAERAKWISTLDELKLPHTNSHTNFIFFNCGHPQSEVAAAMRAHGIDIGRSFPPYSNWARITIGKVDENSFAQQQLRQVLNELSSRS